MLEKIPWLVFFKIPGCSVKKVSSFIVEGRFQFLVIQMTVFYVGFLRVFRGNSDDFCKPFIAFLQKNGATFEEFPFNSRKSFELVAKALPSLKKIHFDWTNLS